MNYLDLFNELQLARDYNEDKKTGVNWRYSIDNVGQRVFIEFQETKTAKDWFYNFLILPITVKNGNKKIIVPRGFYLQAAAAADRIELHFPYLPKDYEFYFVGWSLGGAVAGIAGFILGDLLHIKRHLIQYGTPSYCFPGKSLETLHDNFSTVKDFLYSDDWIKNLVPLYKRGKTIDIHPKSPDNPQTLDERHRVYGHCVYDTPAF